MEFVNIFSNTNSVHKDVKLNLLKLIAPITPHIAEEIWEQLGNSQSIFNESLPKYDETLTRDA